jgi:hypothetical protein
VILVIRFIGILNASIWLGAAVFFTFAAQRTFFSDEIKATGLHSFWPGVMAQLFIARYFQLQCICGVVALAHLLAEWVYLGRALHRFTLGLVLGLFLVGMTGSLWLQPKMKELHLIKYSMGPDYKPVPMADALRIQAAMSFKRWHAASSIVNLIALGSLIFYLWRVTHPSDNLRFVGAPKFRS